MTHPVLVYLLVVVDVVLLAPSPSSPSSSSSSRRGVPIGEYKTMLVKEMYHPRCERLHCSVKNDQNKPNGMGSRSMPPISRINGKR